jgi:cold shock CspA family protein
MSNSSLSVVSSSPRLWGQVKWFKKGIGFLCNLDTREDIFVHHSQLQTSSECYRCLFQGEFVEYEKALAHSSSEIADKDRNKMQAVRVTGVKRFPLMCEVKHRERLEASTGDDFVDK